MRGSWWGQLQGALFLLQGGSAEVNWRSRYVDLQVGKHSATTILRLHLVSSGVEVE